MTELHPLESIKSAKTISRKTDLKFSEGSRAKSPSNINYFTRHIFITEVCALYVTTFGLVDQIHSLTTNAWKSKDNFFI